MNDEEKYSSFEELQKETTNVKLTDWVNEPTINDLKTDLSVAESKHSSLVTRIHDWNQMLEAEGPYSAPSTKKVESQVQPKLIRKLNEWKYSTLSEPFHSSEKMFQVNPATFADEDAAKQAELLLNWQARTKLDRIKLIDDLVRSTVDDGTSIVRVGWVNKTQMQTVTVPVFAYYEIQANDEQQMLALDEALTAKEQDPKTFERTASEEVKAAVEYFEETEIPVFAIQEGEREVEQEVVLENYPTAEVVSFKDIYIDPTCKDKLDNALFIINSYETNKAEILKQKDLYKNLDQIDWDGSVASVDAYKTDSDLSASNNLSDPMKKKVIAYDYWGYHDINDDGSLVPILATWINGVIIRMIENPYPDGKPPFVLSRYMPVKRELFGEPDAGLIIDNQKIIGALTRGMINVMGKSANAQIGYMKDALDPVNAQSLVEGEDYGINPNDYPNGGIIFNTYPDLPASGFNLLEMQNQEAEAMSGKKSFYGGISGSAYGNVAANARVAQDASAKRDMAILRRIADCIKQVGVKIIAMNSEFLSKAETIRVTNRQYIEVTKEDIKGNFDLIVDISTAEVDDAKSQDLAFLLQTMTNTTDPALYNIVLAEIADLKRMPALAEKIRTYSPEPSPQEQEMMELELELKRLEVAKVQSEVELNNAKAMEVGAKADSTSIDNERTITGEKTKEAIESQQAQAKGNMELESHKSLLKRMEEDSKPTSVQPIEISPRIINNPIDRENFKRRNPALNINSDQYDPSQNPSSNLAIGGL